MTSPCLWCDDPCQGGRPLCGPCWAAATGPVFYCKEHSVPTLGDSCAECDERAARKATRASKNAEAIAQLRSIRASLVAGWYKPWPGEEHAKALVGRAIDGAIADLEGREP